MTDRLALATRTLKARRPGWCTICHGPILIGQTIARLISPAAWVHVRCVPVVAARTTAGSPPAAEPKETTR